MQAHLHSRARAAFSLIEVTLALGICSFTIVGVFGLLAVSMDNSRSSGIDTTLASMASEVQADLRGRTFQDVDDDVRAQSLSYRFNNEGVRVSSTNAAATYECKVLGEGDVATGGTRNNLLKLNLEFARVVNGQETQVKTLPWRLARYE